MGGVRLLYAAHDIVHICLMHQKQEHASNPGAAKVDTSNALKEAELNEGLLNNLHVDGNRTCRLLALLEGRSV